MLLLTSCASSMNREESGIPDLFFPTFPSPLNDKGESVYIYYGKTPSQKYLNTIGGYYNSDTNRINLPYEVLENCVVVPYCKWEEILNYASQTEASVMAIEAYRKNH